MEDNKWIPLEGGCDCQHVRYRIEIRPLFVHCCHCRWCQRETGSAFALNAMIESHKVSLLCGRPELIDTPTQSGLGQQIARCPHCRIAVWSYYGGAGELISFMRVGTLDDPDRLPPDIHIFTESRQPWLSLSADVPIVEQYYQRDQFWPSDSLQRFQQILPEIKAYRASRQ